MLKLREPFSQTIHLHIRQDLLQELWEKYVPSSAPEYERVQLIYPDAGRGQDSQKPGQIQILIDLVIKNRIMRMELGSSPKTWIAKTDRMEQILKRVERCYLTQLRVCDLAVYREISRHFTLLDRAEADRRRYRNWEKEHWIIEKQREEYRQFSLFIVQMKEFLSGRSTEIARTLEKEVIASLSDPEYEVLTESFLEWEKELQPAEKEETGSRILVWRDSREEMLRTLDTLETEGVQSVWEQIQKTSFEKLTWQLTQIRERYQRELTEELRGKSLSLLGKKTFRKIEKFLYIKGQEDTVLLSQYTDQAMQFLSQAQKNLEERIRRRETQVFEAYREIYEEVLRTEDTYRENLKPGDEDVYLEILKSEDAHQEISKLKDAVKMYNLSEYLKEQSEDVSKRYGLNRYLKERAEDVPKRYGLNRYLKEQTEDAARMYDLSEYLKEQAEDVSKRYDLSEYLKEQSEDAARRYGLSRYLKEQPGDAGEVPEHFGTEALIEAGTEVTGVPHQMLWEWGEALVVSSQQEAEREDGDPDVFFDTAEGRQEDLQTQLIRRQIEAAKDRNELQKLIAQVSHRAFSMEKGQNREEAKQLVYRDAQLKEPLVQNLLTHVRSLDEKQYGILVKELAQVVKIQMEPASDSERRPGQEEEQSRAQEAERRWMNTDGPTEDPQHGQGYLAAVYPKLAHRIREYERENRRTIQRDLQRLRQIYFDRGEAEPGTGNIGRDEAEPRTKSIDHGELGLSAGSFWYEAESPGTGSSQDRIHVLSRGREEPVYFTQELQYLDKTLSTEEYRQQESRRVQEETLQIRSAQEQLEKRLEEVEIQLRKVENSEREQGNVVEVTEQVKKRLYEELHVEKLRRGLV